ncbi:hypothetical protein M8C21_030640, partial [Ambrosia artemisiifolia]
NDNGNLIPSFITVTCNLMVHRPPPPIYSTSSSTSSTTTSAGTLIVVKNLESDNPNTCFSNSSSNASFWTSEVDTRMIQMKLRIWCHDIATVMLEVVKTKLSMVMTAGCRQNGEQYARKIWEEMADAIGVGKV